MFITPDSIRLCSWRPISPSYRGPQRTPTKCIRWGEEETQAASTCSASSLRRAVSDDKSTTKMRAHPKSEPANLSIDKKTPSTPQIIACVHRQRLHLRVRQVIPLIDGCVCKMVFLSPTVDQCVQTAHPHFRAETDLQTFHQFRFLKSLCHIFQLSSFNFQRKLYLLLPTHRLRHVRIVLTFAKALTERSPVGRLTCRSLVTTPVGTRLNNVHRLAITSRIATKIVWIATQYHSANRRYRVCKFHFCHIASPVTSVTITRPSPKSNLIAFLLLFSWGCPANVHRSVFPRHPRHDCPVG